MAQSCDYFFGTPEMNIHVDTYRGAKSYVLETITKILS